MAPGAFKQAATVTEQLERLATTRQGSDRRRLNRVLHLYTQTRTEQEILERIHQYARCIDGLILCDPGKSAKQFKSRSELLIGPGHHDLMGEIYEVRSAVEHLHEDRYLDPLTRAAQVDLTRKETVIEHIARTTLARISSTIRCGGTSRTKPRWRPSGRSLRQSAKRSGERRLIRWKPWPDSTNDIFRPFN